MGVRVALKLLLHLLILLIAQRVQSRKVVDQELPISNSILRLPSSTNNFGEIKHNHNSKQDHEDHEKTRNNNIIHGHSTNHMDHIDPNLMVFFTLNDLKLGETIPIYFPKKDLKISPKFLPRDQADSIPFSSKELDYLLKYFSFSKDSPQGRAMEDTLNQCETSPIQGETKTCPTSLESMLDFTRGAFGLDEGFTAVTTSFLTELTETFQNYTVWGAPREFSAPKMVACHTMPYPYAVFYCHYQESENKVFKVLVRGENGGLVEAVAVCHMDTSRWGKSHVSFSVLGFGPGTLPVCHFFPAEHLVWVPTQPSSTM